MRTNNRRLNSVTTFCALLSLLLPQATLAQAQPANKGSEATAGQRHSPSDSSRGERPHEGRTANNLAQNRTAPARIKAERATSRQSLAGVLNADGTLNMKAGKAGSFSARGYQMKLGKSGEPHFQPASNSNSGAGNHKTSTTADCSRWDDRFSLPGSNGDFDVIVTDGAFI